MDNTRNLALNMLIRTLEKGEFSQRVLQDAFSGSSFPAAEKAFLNRLYAGTLERLVYLDYVLDRFSSVPVRKMKPVIRNILRMSVYQMRFMDSVPLHACINEAVSLTRKRGFQNLTGFVNGLLRRISREPEETEDLPDYVRCCVPEWIFRLVQTQYADAAEPFFQAVRQENPETWVWFNRQKGSNETILAALEADGCTVRKLPYPDQAYGIRGFSDLTELRAFREGMIMIQDVSSMMAAECAARHAHMPRLILDVCAAPGGKSLYLAHAFPECRIISRDLTASKAGRIRENIERLGFSNIEPQVFDACQPDPSMDGAADIVIADVPCSGLGVIGHKPDLLYRLKESDLTELQTLQQKILHTVRSYVKPGGILVYSTCTINQGENEENTRWLLANTDLTLKQEQMFLPGRDPGDGFYVACFT